MRKQANETILEYLKEHMPDVEWREVIRGAERSDMLLGTLACDRIEFEYVTKTERHAISTYQIYLIDLASVEDIDVVADKVVDALTMFDAENEFFYVCKIKNIKYGQASGMEHAGVALIEFEAEYDW